MSEAKKSLAVVFPVYGEMTIQNVERLRAEVMAALLRTDHRLVLDVGQVNIITTPGLGLLLELKRDLIAKGGDLAVASPRPLVREVMKRTQLDRVLKIAESVETAQTMLT